MALIVLKLTAKEIELLAQLASDQLFRREFIDPKMPGQVHHGEQKVAQFLFNFFIALRRGLDFMIEFAKLFMDQAVPTGGMSGTLLVVAGLIHRSVSFEAAVLTLLTSLISYYAVYPVMAILSVAVLAAHHRDSVAAWSGLAALMLRHVRGVTHPMPQFLRDERQKRMEQSQRV